MSETPEDMETAETEWLPADQSKAPVQPDDVSATEEASSSPASVDYDALLKERDALHERRLQNFAGNIAQQTRQQIAEEIAKLKESEPSPLPPEEMKVLTQAVMPIVNTQIQEEAARRQQEKAAEDIRRREGEWVQKLQQVKSEAGADYTAADEARIFTLLQAGVESEAERLLEEIRSRSGKRTEEITQKRRRAGTGATPVRGQHRIPYEPGSTKRSRRHRALEIARQRQG